MLRCRTALSTVARVRMQSSASSSSAAAGRHWQNFIYQTEGRHWRSFWCRWDSNGALIKSFNAERIFEPLSEGSGCSQRVVYHYSEGTVSEGPLCGPWVIDEGCSTDK